MFQCKKVYYYAFNEILSHTPFAKISMESFLVDLFDLEDDTELTNYQLPSDLTTNAQIYDELFSLIYGRYYHKAAFKIVKLPFQDNPTPEEVEAKEKEWGYKFVSLLNMTYDYYMTLLLAYRENKANLMADIEAISSNMIKYNDTPQNANTEGVYEGDDYISNFTKTEGRSSSPLTTKINRLKEIQDSYKNVMRDWVNQFEKLFMEEQDYEN